MERWRHGRGWSEEELRALLRVTDPSRPNFDARPDEMTLERGWNQVRSEAVVAREAPGAPLPGGPFARARELVDSWRFSDPRIVIPHFAGGPLLGRVMLLELRAPFDLRFLCPVTVCGARMEPATFGFIIATLEGHVEAGQEWFLLTKDPETGEVRFRIEARWRPGQFPTWWSYLGFHLTARRRQRAWHRLAHLRLHHLLSTQAEAVAASPLPEIRDVARRRVEAPRLGIALEQERARRERLPLVAALSALCGARSMLPLALLSRALSLSPRPPGRRRLALWLARPRTSRVLAVLALGELVGDLLPWTPSRRLLMSLLGRATSGALVGVLAAAQGRRRAAGAVLIGAASALAGTFGSAALRARMIRAVGDPTAGLLEDAAVATAAMGAVGLLGARERGRPQPAPV